MRRLLRAGVRPPRCSGSVSARCLTIGGVLGLVGAAATLGGCNPCDGVVGCEGSSRLGVGGQIVDRDIVGAPAVSGVRVEVVPTGGVPLDASSATATTDGTGWWQTSLRARATGDVVVTVTVTPPGDKPYRVDGLVVRASSRRGDGNVLGRWVRRPYISYLGGLRDRATGGPVSGARVTVVRRGGIDVEPTSTTRTVSATDGNGYFLYDVRPLDFGPLIVDFVIERNGLRTTVIPNVAIYPAHEWGPPLPSAGATFVLDSVGGAAPYASRGVAAGSAVAPHPRRR